MQLQSGFGTGFEMANVTLEVSFGLIMPKCNVIVQCGPFCGRVVAMWANVVSDVVVDAFDVQSGMKSIKTKTCLNINGCSLGVLGFTEKE